ncbi:MAG: hypothetical protein Q8P67_27680 [archaeon]|nr:hypothetical protein [archaeon]
MPIGAPSEARCQKARLSSPKLINPHRRTSSQPDRHIIFHQHIKTPARTRISFIARFNKNPRCCSFLVLTFSKTVQKRKRKRRRRRRRREAERKKFDLSFLIFFSVLSFK